MGLIYEATIWIVYILLALLIVFFYYNNLMLQEAVLGESSFGGVVLGVASSKGYYCVQEKLMPRTIEEKVDVHEQCHLLVWDDYEHFCGGNNGR